MKTKFLFAAIIIAMFQMTAMGQGLMDLKHTHKVRADELPPEVDPTFQWDKTLIIPGKFVFLKLPFIMQGGRGTCVASAAANAMGYLDPSFQMSQPELFETFNDNIEGAYMNQLEKGVKNLGFSLKAIKPDGQMNQNIKEELDANHPILISANHHLSTIVGYNTTQKSILFWDQTGHNIKIGNMPEGTFRMVKETQMQQQGIVRIYAVYPPDLTRNKITEQESKKIETIMGKVENLQKYQVINANEGKESLPAYAAHAVPPLLKNILRNGKTLLILTVHGTLLQISPENNPEACSPPEHELNTVQEFKASMKKGGILAGYKEQKKLEKETPILATCIPGWTTKNMTVNDLTNEIILTNNKTYYSLN